MGVVARRYIDFLIVLLILTPLVLALFLQQYPHFFAHLKNVFKKFLFFVPIPWLQSKNMYYASKWVRLVQFTLK